MIYSASEPFCDWLSVTYAPDSPVIDDIQMWLHSAGGSCSRSDDKSSLWNLGLASDRSGTVRLDFKRGYSGVSASGGALAHLRALGLYMDYLSELSLHPHNISRIDVSLDVAQDGASVIDSLRSRFSDGVCSLGRKSLPVTYQLNVRPSDGRETGTFYAGHRSKARTTAAVYDKANEARMVRGEHIPPTTRYEMRMRSEKGRAGASLRDAAEPERLFWHIASPTLLKAPDNVPAWSSGWGGGWSYTRPNKPLPAEVLASRVEFSPEIDSLIVLADTIGSSGRRYLMRKLEEKILGRLSSDSL